MTGRDGVAARIADTEFSLCNVCHGSIRRRGKRGLWVHVVDGNAHSSVVEEHRAVPAVDG